jgi:TonB family protein
MISSASFSPAPAMQALFHSINISTLATWLSVAGFGTVAVVVPQWHPAPVVPGVAETTVLDQHFDLGEMGPPSSGGEFADTVPLPVEPMEFAAAPPELAPLEELSPLPEIPEMPASPAPSVLTATPRAEPAPGRTGVASSPPSRSIRSTATSGGGEPGGAASASGISSASRLAAGSMPAPSYPSESRRKGQTGTVLVEFTVDTAGRVISAHAKSPSPWPLLNHEAVRTVRRWKFPPGGIMKLQRPIVFQLR